MSSGTGIARGDVAMTNECSQKQQVVGNGSIGGVAPNPAVADALKHAEAVKGKLAAETEQNDAVLAQLKAMERNQRLEHLFSYHAPTDAQQSAYSELRWQARRLAETILSNVPEGADQSAALRKVREAVMTANAGIACNGQS